MKDTTGNLSSDISPAIADGVIHAAGPGDVPLLPPFGEDADRFEQWLIGFEKAAKKRGGSDAEKVLLCVAALRQREQSSIEDAARAGYLLAMWHFQTVRQHFIEHEIEKRDVPLRSLYERLRVAIGRGDAGSVTGRELLAALDVHVKPSKLRSKLKSKLDERLLDFLKSHIENRTADLLGVRVSTDNEGTFLLDEQRHTRKSITELMSRRKKSV